MEIDGRGRVSAKRVNLEGDDQADRGAHGGPDKAVYAYSMEDTRWWEREIGRALGYGAFGENLTIEGTDVNDALIGERCRSGLRFSKFRNREYLVGGSR